MNQNYRSKNKSTKSKNKGTRANTKVQNKNTTRESFDSVHESQHNDASWYGDTPQLISDAASLAYSIPSGSKFKIGDVNFAVPGLMRLKVHPTVGISTDNYSPVNVAARNIYSFVRHANSGHYNYDSPDLMIYLLSMDSVYSLYAHLVRIYGTLRLYTQKNRYYPTAILEGFNLDVTDFMNNMADFRYYINQFVKKMGSFCVPASMSYFRRHMWMYEGYFVDDTSEKAQTYMFVPDGFYKFDELSGAGQLIYVPYYQSEPFTVEGLIQYCNNIISPIFASEDMNIMSGDILKAYGDGGIFKVAGIDTDYVVLPKYDLEVLSQIQNCTIFEPLENDNITQDVETGAILFNPEIVNTYTTPGSQLAGVLIKGMYCENKVLNMYKDVVSPDDTMVATRLTAITDKIESSGTTKTVVKFGYAGSEIITGAGWCTFSDAEGSWAPKWNDTIGARALQNTTYLYNNATVHYDLITAFASFNYHPEIRFMMVDRDDSVVRGHKRFLPFMDLNNFTIVTSSDLSKMHETALLSEFSCPQMGAFNNKYQ